MPRTISQEVLIRAAPEALWRALTDARELARWLALDATVVPGVGGSIRLAWDDDREGIAPMTVWEPERRLQWIEHDDDRLIIVDIDLEERGTCTALQLVQRDFSRHPPSDTEETSTTTAWAWFLQHLKWYLERHAGEDREVTGWSRPVAFAPAEAFARLTGPAGLSSDDVLAQVRTGDLFQMTTAFGEVLSGCVLTLCRPTCQIGLTLVELNDALLFIEIAQTAGGTVADFWLSTYGLDPWTLTRVRSHYARLYRNALGVD